MHHLFIFYPPRCRLINPELINNLVSFLAFVFAIVSLAAPQLMQGKVTPDRYRVWKYFIFGTWLLIPPIWFWMENAFLFTVPLKTDATEARFLFERFQHTQALSRNIWLAFLAVLGILYFKENWRSNSNISRTKTPERTQYSRFD